MTERRFSLQHALETVAPRLANALHWSGVQRNHRGVDPTCPESMLSLMFWQQLGLMAVWKDAGDEVCVAILFVAGDFAVSEVNDEDIVIVVTLTVTGEVFAQCLHNDDFAAIDNARRDRRSLYQGAVQRPKNLIDNGLLADKLAAPRTFTNRAPNNVFVTSLPKRSAVALGDLVENIRHKLRVL